MHFTGVKFSSGKGTSLLCWINDGTVCQLSDKRSPGLLWIHVHRLVLQVSVAKHFKHCTSCQCQSTFVSCFSREIEKAPTSVHSCPNVCFDESVGYLTFSNETIVCKQNYVLVSVMKSQESGASIFLHTDDKFIEGNLLIAIFTLAAQSHCSCLMSWPRKAESNVRRSSRNGKTA